MKISRGPVIDAYAEKFGINPDEVVEWVNSYVNSPVEWITLRAEKMYEETAELRASLIRLYLQREAVEQDNKAGQGIP